MSNETNQIWGLVILIILLCILGASIAIILILNQKKFHFNKKLLKVESEFQESMLLTKIEIQEQTFHHIAREIHDHIGQRLTMARLQVNQAAYNTDKFENEKLLEASYMIEEAIADLKHLSRSITANLIRDEGLLSALQMEIDRVKKIVPIDIELVINKEDDPPFMTEENELIIYRIIQEALQNIMKHSEANKVDIQMTYNNKYLNMIIRDNGKGFEQLAYKTKSDAGNSGLANLKKRTELLCGSFHIDSKPDEGTTLVFQFPLINPKLIYAANQ
jgi:two-component system NarL family sensor kinase